MLGMHECGMCRMCQTNYYSWWEDMTHVWNLYEIFFSACVIIV
jgi:hypothetical protein